MEENKQRFLDIYKENIKREGSDRLLNYLENGSDFFSAPASTRFHGNYRGGLLEHSLNVYDCLCDLCARPRYKEVYGIEVSGESAAICSLLHDLCKTNYYVEGTRNVKENGVWHEVPFYTVDDRLPYGHGEKSVYIISGFMRLTREEAFAIRYHMGFSENENSINVGRAYEMFPLALALSTADSEATFFMEKGN